MGWVSSQEDNLDNRGEREGSRLDQQTKETEVSVKAESPYQTVEKSAEYNEENSPPASKSKKPRLRESQWRLVRSAGSAGGKDIGNRLKREKKGRRKRRKNRNRKKS